jgi:hypothetical protein
MGDRRMTKLEQLEAALAAATEGPWEYDGKDVTSLAGDICIPLRYDKHSQDAELIVFLRNHAADLLRVVRLAAEMTEYSDNHLPPVENPGSFRARIKEALAPLVEGEK